MEGFNYCLAWPEELKEAERMRYRAVCEVRCLESALDRIDMSDFDAHMERLQAARERLLHWGAEALKRRVSCLSAPTAKE